MSDTIRSSQLPTQEAADAIRRQIDVSRTLLADATESTREQALAFDEIAERYPGSGAEATMLFASASQRAAQLLTIVLLDVLRHASALSASARALDAIESSVIAAKAREGLA